MGCIVKLGLHHIGRQELQGSYRVIDVIGQRLTDCLQNAIKFVEHSFNIRWTEDNFPCEIMQ